MAATVYRFRWRGCDLETVKRNVSPSVLASVSNAMPKAWVDVSLDPGPPGSDEEIDLNAAMLTMGWIPFSVNPTTPLQGLTTKQEIFTELLVDQTKADPVFSVLLSVPVTTDSGFLDLSASVAGSCDLSPALFRLKVDGLVVANGGTGFSPPYGCASLDKRVAVAAGAHTVDLEWRALGLGQVDVHPATVPDSNHASLTIREVVS